MGDSTFAHPCSQAFALPQLKDKQRSQPTPCDYMYNPLYIIIIYSTGWDIIYPRRRLPLQLSPVSCCLSCEVREHRMITFSNAFRDPPYKRLGGLISISKASPRQSEASFIALSLHMLSIDVLTRPVHKGLA